MPNVFTYRSETKAVLRCCYIHHRTQNWYHNKSWAVNFHQFSAFKWDLGILWHLKKINRPTDPKTFWPERPIETFLRLNTFIKYQLMGNEIKHLPNPCRVLSQSMWPGFIVTQSKKTVVFHAMHHRCHHSFVYRLMLINFCQILNTHRSNLPHVYIHSQGPFSQSAALLLQCTFCRFSNPIHSRSQDVNSVRNLKVPESQPFITSLFTQILPT
jgi:hypothetical protein